MRLIAICLSVVTLVYLTYTFFLQTSTNEVAAQKTNTSELIVPAYTNETQLEAEKTWQKLKNDRIKAAQPIADVADEADNTLQNKDILAFGDNEYVLYGIFNANKQTNAATKGEKSTKSPSNAFILIKSLKQKGKSEKNQMLKVRQGEELLTGVTLVTVTSNSISFKQQDKLIKFKLFEPKK